jgi:pimeloyl-ACP methyl ester carboxylesterase
VEYIQGNFKKKAVLVHGAGYTSLVWKYVIEKLHGNFPLYAVNLPGHPRGEIKCRTIQEYAAELLDFIRSIGKVDLLCGHSMGGAVALSAALSEPDSFGSLVLVSTSSTLRVSRKILNGLREDPMQTVERILTPLSIHNFNEEILQKAKKVLPVDNFEIMLNDFLACDGFDITEKVRYVSQKTLIVCGEQDRMTPVNSSLFLKENIADSRLFVIRNCGHMVPIEKPDTLASLISSFADEL